MNRRNLFKTGAQVAALGIIGSNLGMSTEDKVHSASASDVVQDGTPAIIKSYTAADHRKRLENIAFGEKRISKCMRKHLVTGYIPGHAVYSPAATNWEPNDKDDKAMSDLRDLGIGIIQPWSGWATCWGKNYLIAKNPDGFKRLIKLAHNHGLKVIPYTSSQYFERTDENFKKEWAWNKSFDLVEFDYHLAHCSPSSPEWRAYTMHRHIHVMDEYGVDGLYNDLGYMRPGEQENFYGPIEKTKFAEDEVLAFREGPKQDGAMGDFLALLYSEVKRRNGIYKLHKEGVDTVYTDLKIYDYLWVGEANKDFDFLRESTKNFNPYITPQRLVTVTPDEENESFINSIPYMQFPLIGHGQPGEQGEKFIKTFSYWFKYYLQLVEEGSWAWIDIVSPELFLGTMPQNTVATLFVNRDVYLVLANYNHKPVEIVTTDKYVSVLDQQGQENHIWKLNGRSMQILKLSGQVDEQEA